MMDLFKKFILFMGPVGSGKDTQADLLSHKLDYHIFKSNKVLEHKFNHAKPEDADYEDMLREKKMWEDGILLTPSWVASVVNDATDKLIASGVRGLIFSGSPRTLPEAKVEMDKLQSIYGRDAILLIQFDLPGEESIRRNSIRLFCENSHPIDPKIAKINPIVCPDDGGKVIKRALDNPDVIKVRLEEYKNRTVPAVDYIKDLGIDSIEVSGEGTIEEVSNKIWSELQRYKI